MWNTFPKEAVEAWEKYCRLFEEEREKNSNMDLLWNSLHKLGDEIMSTDNDRYFDGISPELQRELDRMTPEEREASLEAERKKCDEMNEW